MATAFLDILLKKWGTSFIFWVFLAMLAIIGALGWYVLHQADELKDCNHELVGAEKQFSVERERILRESITVYQSMLQRLEKAEKKRR